MPDPLRWRTYRKQRSLRKERWYLDVGPATDEWEQWTAKQQAAFKRWQRYYRRRRALRELARGPSI